MGNICCPRKSDTDNQTNQLVESDKEDYTKPMQLYIYKDNSTIALPPHKVISDCES